MKSYLQLLYNGIIKENPSLILMLGMCPTLAVTTSASNGMGMGLSTMAVLVLANLLISLLRKIIPDAVRLPAFIVVVASLVTVVEMVTQAYMPALYESLGLYIPLIVVNCIILGRAESYASKNPVLPSIFDGIGMGLGFTLALTAMATVREVFGAASFAGMAIPFLENYKIEFLVKAPGGMLVYGLLIALVCALTQGNAPKKKSFSCAGCPSAAYCQTGSCQTEKSEKEEA
jgi:electron transport complex protein RnfE